MSKVIKSFNLFVLIILLVATIGCDSNNNNTPTALTENGFAEDSGAQTVQDNRITLINTSICPLCNLRGANLSGLNLRGANLRGVDLSGAYLFKADLSGATWCDGNCICANPSIGTCGGCASIDTCIGT